MEHSYDDIVLLERYIERSLNEEDMKKVEKRMKEEPEFNELFRQETLLVQGIRYGHLKTKWADLKALEATLPAVEPEKPAGRVIEWRSNWKVIAAAASLALIIGSYFIATRPVEPDVLYARYFQVYPNVFEPVVRGTNQETPRAQAFAAYDRGDYARAASGFNQLLKEKEEPEILLLLGNSNLILGNAGEAKENFIRLSRDFENPNTDLLAKWYLSLCYLKLGEKESAKVLLEEIAVESSSYQEKAKEMLKKLD